MTEIKLKAERRSLPTPALNEGRVKGNIPAELYGMGQKNQHLFLNSAELEKVYAQAGGSRLVDLAIGDEPLFKVLIQAIQRHPVTSRVLHLDLYQVKMDQALTTDIPLVFLGESKAVKELGGTLVKSLEKIAVSCLPQDLIPSLEVDISGLNNFHDVVRVKDLKIPSTIKVLINLEEVVATAVPVTVEKEAPAAAATAAATAEVAGEAGKEGEVAGVSAPETPAKPEKK